MTLLEIIGYFGAFCVGLIMGLTGSGGSILSVPILAYLFQFDEKVATAYSLFIVGTTALFGSIKQFFSKEVSMKAVWMFGIPAILGVTLVRRYVVPAMPEILFHLNGFAFTRRMFILGLFAILMLLSAYSVLHKPKYKISEKKHNTPEFHPLIITEGFFIGGFMGLVGAGGGFLIVPALMFIAKLPIKRAIATSLVIVCMNSMVGFFLGDFKHLEVDWKFLISFIAVSFVGMLLGSYLTRFIRNDKLKKYFAYFILVMGIFILIMEFFIYRK